MNYLHHSTLQFFIYVLLNKREDIQLSTQKGIKLPKRHCGPFELDKIMTNQEYPFFWKDLQKLGLLTRIVDCEIMPDDSGNLYVSRLGSPKNSYAIASRPSLSPFTAIKEELPTVIVLSKEMCLNILSLYIQQFQEGKLHSLDNVYSLEKHQEIAHPILWEKINNHGNPFMMMPSADASFKFLEYYLLQHTHKNLCIKNIFIKKEKLVDRISSYAVLKIEVLKLLLARLALQCNKRPQDKEISNDWPNKVSWRDWVVNIENNQCSYKGTVLSFHSANNKQKKLLNVLVSRKGKATVDRVVKELGLTGSLENQKKRIRSLGSEIKQKINQAYKEEGSTNFNITVCGNYVRIE